VETSTTGGIGPPAPSVADFSTTYTASVLLGKTAGPGGTNRAFAIVNTAVAPGSVGNVVNAGICTFVSGGSSGSIGFTDGTTCP
jgi:hypothetical protein